MVKYICDECEKVRDEEDIILSPNYSYWDCTCISCYNSKNKK